MKRILIPILLIPLLSCFSCRQNNLTPKESIDCPDVGIQEAHPLSGDFQTILDAYVAEGFPAISASIQTPDGLWVGSAGLADIKKRVALNSCHVLFSGSVAKMYTVTAALRLIEQGLLDLDDPISTYLPQDLVNRLPNAQLATVRQLMNHSAGIPDHDYDEELSKYLDKNDAALPSALAQLSYLYDDPAVFAPGDSVAYSSANTLVLSLVIDKASGKHHADLISSEIIQKLNLTETYYKNENGYPSPENLVKAYYGQAKKNKDITDEAINYCMGSQGDAGIIASTHDYYLFMKGLMEGKILSPATVDSMKQSLWVYEDDTYALGIGLGLFMIKKEGRLIKIGHSGGTVGGMTHVFYYPSHDSYISLATNTMSEDDQDFVLKWVGATLVGTGARSIMDDLENLILQ